MFKKKRTLHLICNSHIDPVWLWQWPEGASVAISTFRVAAELAEKDKRFIFNHNEAILYEWIRQYEPDLFRRIQKLVKSGRWHIMGGWFLQPDCNMPCGESFVRQIITGRNYFKKYFNAEPKTAINFDSFGHTRGLVQILAKSGFDSYLFGRPREDTLRIPDDFLWVGYDGSKVMATRFRAWYHTHLGKAAEQLEQWIAKNSDKTNFVFLWGVGNHGGGPSKFDLQQINKTIDKNKDYDIIHSTPEDYFKQLSRQRENLPERKKDLNSWAPGCYTSQIRIKQKHRQLENELYSAEKMACAASLQGLMEYPAEELKQSLLALMTGQFHDILPGSSIPAVEDNSLDMLGHGIHIAEKIKVKAFFALSSGQKKTDTGEIPILIYNHHPFKVKTLVECEFHQADFDLTDVFNQVHVYNNGRIISSQVEREVSNLAFDWRKKVVFSAELEPGQMNRFDCRIERLNKKPQHKLKAKNGKIRFKTKELDVVINTKTGLVDKYKAAGRDFLGISSFEPIVIADNEDPWGTNVLKFRKVIGRFKLSPKDKAAIFSGLEPGKTDSVRVIEDGPVRSIIEAVFSYGDSFLIHRYKLPKKGTEIELETIVNWNEKNKMLKLSVPALGAGCKYIGQVAYGRGELPDNGDEAVAQKWVAVVSKKDDKALTCINNCIYGSDFSKDGLRLSLLRGPAYSALPYPYTTSLITGMPRDRYSPRIDQGRRCFRFWLNGGKVKQTLDKIDRDALVKNEQPYVLSHFPPGDGYKPKPLAVLSDNVVQITAIKKAENNNDLIIRLFEPTGKRRKSVLSLPAIGRKIALTLSAFEIKTLRINPKTGKYIETNLLERKIKKT